MISSTRSSVSNPHLWCLWPPYTHDALLVSRCNVARDAACVRMPTRIYPKCLCLFTFPQVLTMFFIFPTITHSLDHSFRESYGSTLLSFCCCLKCTSLCSEPCDRGATYTTNPHCYRGFSSIEKHFHERYHARKYDLYHLVVASISV